MRDFSSEADLSIRLNPNVADLLRGKTRQSATFDLSRRLHALVREDIAPYISSIQLKGINAFYKNKLI
jgi:hypothetical protein